MSSDQPGGMASEPVATDRSESHLRRRQQLVAGRLRERLLPLVVAEGVIVAVLGALVWHARGGDWLDSVVAKILYAEPGNGLRSVASAVTLFGSPVAVAVGAVAVAGWAWRRFRDPLLTFFCPLAVVACSVAERLLKLFFARARPATAVLAHEVDFSYPSGHVTGATALALATILLVWAGGPRRMRAPTIAALVIYAVAIVVSRLILGVHYLTDVVGAGALATAGVLVIGWLCSIEAPASPVDSEGRSVDC